MAAFPELGCERRRVPHWKGCCVPVSGWERGSAHPENTDLAAWRMSSFPRATDATMDCMSYSLASGCSWWVRVSIHTLHVMLGKVGRGQTPLVLQGTFGRWISDPCVEREKESETARLANRSVEAGRGNRLVSQGRFSASEKEVSCWRQLLWGSPWTQALLTMEGGIPLRWALWDGVRSRRREDERWRRCSCTLGRGKDKENLGWEEVITGFWLNNLFLKPKQ